MLDSKRDDVAPRPGKPSGTGTSSPAADAGVVPRAYARLGTECGTRAAKKSVRLLGSDPYVR